MGAIAAGELGRLRWHSRRALLELDLLLERFWQRSGGNLDEEGAAQLGALLAMEDHDLWDVVSGRKEIGDARLQPMLAALRQV